MSTRRLIEVGVRAVAVIVVLAVFPHIFSDDVRFYWLRTRHVSLHHLPYRNFLWEYPPLSVIPMAMAVALRHQLAAFSVLFGMLMAGAELASLELVRCHLPAYRREISAYWYVVGIPLCTVAWFRLDWLPVLFAVLAMVAVAHGRSGAWAMTAGFASKLWPPLIAVMLVVERRYRQLAVCAAGVVAVVVGWYAFSPEGVRQFLVFRRGTGFQIEGVVGSLAMLGGAGPVPASNTWVVMAGRLGWLDPLMTLSWLVLVVGTAVVARRHPYDPWSLMGGLVVALLLSSRLLSPQFLVWALPFVAVAWARGDRVCGWAFAVATAITIAYLWLYPALLNGHPLLTSSVVFRNILLVVMAVRLFDGGLRPRPAADGPELRRPAGGPLRRRTAARQDADAESSSAPSSKPLAAARAVAARTASS